MVNLKINRQVLRREFNLMKEFLTNTKIKKSKAYIANAVMLLARRWKQNVSGTPLPDGTIFKSRTYRESIRIRGNSVVAIGKLPGIIEDGFGSFDMKPGLLAGKNAKTSKAGNRYNVIPLDGKGTATPSFMVVSSKSKPSSWIHPGLKAKNIAEQTRVMVGKEIADRLVKIMVGK